MKSNPKYFFAIILIACTFLHVQYALGYSPDPPRDPLKDNNREYNRDSACIVISSTPLCEGTLKIRLPQKMLDSSGFFNLCIQDSIGFMVSNTNDSMNTYYLEYGDGESQQTMVINQLYFHRYDTTGEYQVVFKVNGDNCKEISYTYTIKVIKCFRCEDCIGSFAPEPGKKYIVGAWVKEGDSPGAKTTYTKPEIYIGFRDFGDSVSYVGPFIAHGQIIDGWQRIENEFMVPPEADSIFIKLNQRTTNSEDVCYFDDLRIFPEQGSVKSYVFDPVTLRLVAELDENNYATFYEYDEEGNLIRIKKETERGIMTIQENRNNTYKSKP